MPPPSTSTTGSRASSRRTSGGGRRGRRARSRWSRSSTISSKAVSHVWFYRAGSSLRRLESCHGCRRRTWLAWTHLTTPQERRMLGMGRRRGTPAAAGLAPGAPLLSGTARSARAPSRRRPSGTCTLQGRLTAGGRPRQRRRLSGRGPAGRATSPCKTSATTACTLPVSATGAASSRRRRWWCPTAGTRRRGQPPRCGSAARATSSSPRTSTWRSISLGRGTSAELSPRRVCPGAARGGGARGDRRWRRFSRQR